MSKPKRKTWRCFHCDEVFRGPLRAALHFGSRQDAAPACKINAVIFRKLELELAKYRAEDTDLHRQIAAMEGKHQLSLMRAEEAGYSKGLRDGRKLRELGK
jgi:hypothetical protein